jgi:hypothetical protein
MSDLILALGIGIGLDILIQIQGCIHNTVIGDKTGLVSVMCYWFATVFCYVLENHFLVLLNFQFSWFYYTSSRFENVCSLFLFLQWLFTIFANT